MTNKEKSNQFKNELKDFDEAFDDMTRILQKKSSNMIPMWVKLLGIIFLATLISAFIGIIIIIFKIALS